MKLADTIRPDLVTEIILVDGTQININIPGTIYELEYLDDSTQQLAFQTLVTAGRRKGTRARMIVPYTAIKSVTVQAPG